VDRVSSVEPNVLSQTCESRQALDRIADKWTCLIVYALLGGRRRHGELKRMIEGISQKMLTQTPAV
jgi:DNA-binding HxlR family transcriptional regulator